MIDKEKLLKRVVALKYDNRGYVTIFDIIKNFPEEPAIDFDALYDDYMEKSDDCDFSGQAIAAVADYNDFLKSNNLCAPVKRKSPVKTIYALKKEYQDVFKDFGFLHSTFDTHSYEPLPENIKKYYDRTDEVDYSQIPSGSIVEFTTFLLPSNKQIDRVIEVLPNIIKLEHLLDISHSKIKTIRVVEWAKEVTK